MRIYEQKCKYKTVKTFCKKNRPAAHQLQGGSILNGHSLYFIQITSSFELPQFQRPYRIAVGDCAVLNHAFQFLWIYLTDLQYAFMADIGLIIVQFGEKDFNPA